MGKKIGQKLAIFQPNFCPQTTTSCGQTLLFLLFSTILHHYYTLNVLRHPEVVHPTRLLLGLSVHAGVKFFQEGMIIPVCFVAWHRVDIDVMDAVENAFFDIRIIPF